jgi:cobalt-zinc-cadmium resistance protein CzcA
MMQGGSLGGPLARLVEFALTQRLLVSVLALLAAGAGAISLLNLPIDAFPDVSSTQVKIIMKAPGMTPEEVEARVVAPIEQEMLGIPGQRMLRSVSKYAIADVTLDFRDGVDAYWARQQVSERLVNVVRDLPAGVSGGLAPITTPLGEMLMFTIEGEASLEQKRGVLDWVIRPALRTLPGVADVNALGGMVRSFEVIPDAAALSARGISLQQLRMAIEGNNRNDGAGRLSQGEETLLVRAEGAIRNLQDLAAVVVTNRAAQPVRVSDVAQVRIGSLTRYGAVTHGGKGEAVQGLVLGLRGANANEVVQGVRARLAELAPSLPAGMTLDIFYDRGVLVERAVGTVSRALLEAVVLVLVLLILFLGDWRAALVVAAALPLSALLTFLLMGQAGLSANLMSLGGLAIAIGMLVDGAVVVVENIATHLAQPSPLSRLHRIYRAVREVIAPVTAGILIIIIVFLPLLSLQGLEGKLFTPVALTIVFALAASLLLSLTVVPVLASFFLRSPALNAVSSGSQQSLHETAHEPPLVRRAQALYAPLLAASLAHPRRVVIGATVALLLALGVYSQVGKTFMPVMDEGDIIVQLERLPSISLQAAADADLALQRAILARVPEVRDIVARLGSDEIGLDPMGLNQTDTFLVLKPMAQWRQPDKAWVSDRLREVLSEFPGTAYTFSQPIEMRVAEMVVGVRGDLALKIFGHDLEQLNALAAQTAEVLRGLKGAEDVFTLKNEGVQYFRVAIDRLAAGRLGLQVDDIADALRAQVEGQLAGLVLEPGRRTQLLLRGDASLRESPALFSAITLTLPDASAGGGAARSVPLASVARLERVEGPVKIDRENAQRYVVVQANVRDRDLVGFVDEARAAVAAAVSLPQGVRLRWGGQFENQQRAAARLALVVPVALALIFLLLFATFGSLRQAVMVFANIPFAMVGGVFALALSGEYLSVPASVGFIALLGIAVLNGVVMITHFNQLQAAGLPMQQVVTEGAMRRLRPVLMTAGIAALGLVPLLFASGPGSEIQRPLASVVIGGLLSSTFLTLVMLPILYRRYGREAQPPQTASSPGAAS